LKVGTVLIISTRIAVINVSYFKPCLGALFFPSIDFHKNSQVKIGLKTYQGLNVFTVSSSSSANGAQNNSQSVLAKKRST
jgi:hypothetical protein